MISVCIATYNGSKYIEEQLYSILSQIGPDDEIIISDDHSVDDTIEVIHNIHDERIKVFPNNREKGYTSNFENALLYASGDYIFLSDQDDIWEENKVEYCIKQFQKYDFVVSDASLVDERGNLIAPSFFQKRIVYKSLCGNIYKFGYLGCCMAFKKEILKRALPFPANHYYCTHDNWLFLIAKTYYRTLITSAKLIKYRRHTNNTSEGGLVNHTSLLFKLSYRCYLLYHLSKRFSISK